MSDAVQTKERTSLLKQVQAMLRHEDSVSLRGSLGRMFKGIGLCAIFGIVFATLLSFAANSLLHRAILSWIAWFGLFWVLLVGLLFLMQSRRHPGYIVGSLADDPVNEDNIHVARGSPYLLWIIWGPSAILDGIAAMRGKWTARQNAFFKRAGRMALELAKYDGGVEIRALMHPPEDMAIFNGVIDWLDAHDYLGKSSDGERFWITSIGRKKLAEHGIQPKVIGGQS